MGNPPIRTATGASNWPQYRWLHNANPTYIFLLVFDVHVSSPAVTRVVDLCSLPKGAVVQKAYPQVGY